MPVVEYRFRACDDAPSSSMEWMRQVGVAIATAAWVLPDETVEIHAGTDPRERHAELVTFCVPRGEEALAAALCAAGASRLLSVRVCEGRPATGVAPFGFLHQSTLVRPFWHGPANAADLHDFTGLRTICSTDDAEDYRMLAWFGAADLPDRLTAFVGPERGVAPPRRINLARSTCRQLSRPPRLS